VKTRAERPHDGPCVREVNLLAFEHEEEARLADELREGGHARVSLVAEEGRAGVFGHVLYGEVSVGGALRALAPVAVVPGRLRMGVGSARTRAGAKACAAAGFDAVFVPGEAGFYSRFGFSSESARDFETPCPKECFMAPELSEGSLEGVLGRVEHPSPFGGS
jgi:putative acetyltransferase